MKPNPYQHGHNWWLQRRGRLTSSRMKRVLSTRWQSWNTLMDELERELAADTEPERFPNGPPKAIRWGWKWEPVAIAKAAFDAEWDYIQPPFKRHRELEYVGASSDFLLVEGLDIIGNGEVKCPINPPRHTRVLMNAAVPREHYPQIDCQMAVHNLDVTKFVSYCPNMPDHESRLMVLEVERDTDREHFMLEQCYRFYQMFKRGERMGPPLRKQPAGFPALTF